MSPFLINRASRGLLKLLETWSYLMSVMSTARKTLIRLTLIFAAIGAVTATVAWATSPFDAQPVTADAEGESQPSGVDSAPSIASAWPIASTPSGGMARTEGPTRIASIGQLPPDVAADGEVSWEEYEEAIWNSVECMESAGLEIRTYPHLDISGKVLSYTVWSPDATEDEHISNAAVECESKHALAAKMAWANQIRPTEEEVNDARAALAQCLLDGGTPEEHVNMERLIEAEPYSNGLFPICANEVSAEFGIPHFGG